ncbi:MAG TPA: hypothetical protein PLW86_00125, partial [Rhodocyclaceae bacterium]|nr:hypothetical protein [Rhodocyclaceae bacterium]
MRHLVAQSPQSDNADAHSRQHLTTRERTPVPVALAGGIDGGQQPAGQRNQKPPGQLGGWRNGIEKFTLVLKGHHRNPLCTCVVDVDVRVPGRVRTNDLERTALVDFFLAKVVTQWRKRD